MKRKLAGLLVTALLLLGGCTEKELSTPFQLTVIPQELKGFSITGQEIHYLVTVSEEAKTDPVTISATSEDAEIKVVQQNIVEGKVAEVIAVPKPASVGKSVKVKIEGKRGSIANSQTMTFDVLEGEDDRKDRAKELLDPFITYLAETHPEYKITKDTLWTGTMVSPQWLVVAHYLFFSDEWEIHLEWHIMIPPSDWARIDLRHRADQTKPSAAYEISSVSQNAAPAPMEVPTEIWR